MNNMLNKPPSKRRDASKNIESRPWKLEFFALIGFCISGLIFVVSGVQNGDLLTVSGSLIWLLSCLMWMATYRRFF